MNVDTVMDRLKDSGMRVTPQRVEVIRLLFKLQHPSAEQIYSAMTRSFPNVSQATVYNTLHMLKELKLVRELNYGNRTSQFELAHEGHWHFNCKVCGKIFDMEAEETDLIQNIARKNETFRNEGCRIELFGTCPECL